MNTPHLLNVVTHASSDSVTAENESTSRRGVGFWGVLLALVLLFGYLTASRRKSFGTLVEQITDIVRDFRGYDPEF